MQLALRLSPPRARAVFGKKKREQMRSLPVRILSAPWLARCWLGAMLWRFGVVLFVQYQFSMAGLSQSVDLVSVTDQDFIPAIQKPLRVEIIGLRIDRCVRLPCLWPWCVSTQPHNYLPISAKSYDFPKYVRQA